jgi:hypothetical protein
MRMRFWKALLWSMVSGLILAFISLWVGARFRDSSVGISMRRWTSPFLSGADAITGLFFTHNRIAPGVLESFFFDAVFVVLLGGSLGILIFAVLAASRLTSRRVH